MNSFFTTLFTILALCATSIQGFAFVGNSATMYEKVCEASPFFVRHFTRKAILKEIELKGYQEVTEKAFFQIIQDVTPEKFLEKTMAILEQHKSESTEE